MVWLVYISVIAPDVDTAVLLRLLTILGSGEQQRTTLQQYTASVTEMANSATWMTRTSANTKVRAPARGACGAREYLRPRSRPRRRTRARASSRGQVVVVSVVSVVSVAAGRAAHCCSLGWSSMCDTPLRLH
ncbi:hypothetical protein EYF80_041245 [Liparis tanakae]|uniref:Uncharacterized protein n=1 Tax=Liparis tanakae TaxID=230148 RepID=A0A4Z2G4V5_9TELE|nr:hypothetical protein EYF80_041245 [Liparis tanakae]